MRRSDAFDVVTKHAAEYFLCHRLNRFMLQRPTDKMVLPYDRAWNNIAENGASPGSRIRCWPYSEFDAAAGRKFGVSAIIEHCGTRRQLQFGDRLVERFKLLFAMARRECCRTKLSRPARAELALDGSANDEEPRTDDDYLRPAWRPKQYWKKKT